jgi:spermidine/putrescine transport system permease protein
MKKKGKFFSILYIIVCFLFFYLPIIVTMVFSFNSSKSLTKMSGFSLRWYENLISDSSIMKAVYVSVSIAVFATIIATILGTFTAIGLSKSRKILKEVILNINNIPIMNPDIVTAIGLMILFSSIKMEKGYLTMLLAHVAFCTPYVITSVYPKVRNLDPNLANAAMDLGATPFQALTKVIIPMLKEGIYAGILLSFTMSFDDFVVSYFVTGNGVQNISIIVYNMTKRTNPTINALSTIVILVIAVTLVLINVIPAILKKRRNRAVAAQMAEQTPVDEN